MADGARDPALEVRGLSKAYGDTVALRDVTLQVHAGEVFGLLGPNGAGKTTLIRIVLDILRADTGEVRLFGEPFARPALDRIGYLPEERGLYTKHKVLDVMAYFGMLKGLSRGEARRRAQAWLERVGLPEVGRWKVERLSKGMSQKVQIASALLAEPDLCVLDEPFSGLDPVNVRLVRGLIEERREAGRTTVLSTHRMNMVEALCDRVGLINAGNLVAYGAVQQLREELSPALVRLRGPATLPALDGVSHSEHADGVWTLSLDEAVTPEGILRELIAAGAEVSSFEPVLAPMEDVFVHAVEAGT